MIPAAGAGVRAAHDLEVDQAVVHQSAGMVSVHGDCDLDAAEDLLAARAFAAGVPVEEVAAQVIRGETRLW